MALEGINMAIDPIPGRVVFGVSIIVSRRAGTVLVADTAIHERPDAETLAGIARGSAAAARRLGLEPRVAFLSFSTFGDPRGTIPGSIRDAVKLLTERGADFEFDGEMSADVALDPGLRNVTLSVLPADRAGQCADHAGAARRAHPDAVGAAADQCDGDRPAADRPVAFGADRADAGGGEPDARRRLPRGACRGTEVTRGSCRGQTCHARTQVLTIGYEGATPDRLIASLKDAGVRVLVDVRALANSRRPGFAKTALTASLEAAGIGYLHLRALGTPAEGRAAARSGRPAEMRRIFAAHLAGTEAQAALANLSDLARPAARLPAVPRGRSAPMPPDAGGRGGRAADHPPLAGGLRRRNLIGAAPSRASTVSGDRSGWGQGRV